MSVSSLSFSASLPPFNYTSGYGNNFSNTNLAVTGNLSVATGNDSANGANTPTVLSSVTENGVNFAESSAAFNGNQLTVDYQSSIANGGGAGDNGSIAGPLTVNINGNGIDFTPQSANAAGAAVTTTYATSPNGSYNNAVSGAAVSTGSSTDNENYTLKSLALVGNSIIATYQITNPPSTQATLTPTAAAPVSGLVTSSSPSAINTSGANFVSKGNMTIGDLLANANGLTLNGTLTGALQQPPSIGPATGYPDANSVLAATLNPSIDLSPDTSLQVTDFINTSLNAFPTSAPASTTPDNSSNGANTPNGNGPGNSPTAGNTGPAPGAQSPDFSANSNSGYGSTTNTTPAYDNSFTSASATTGIYSAISNANASTIRGAGVDTVA